MSAAQVIDALSRSEYRTALEVARAIGFTSENAAAPHLKQLAEERIVLRRRAERCGRPYEYRLV